MSQIYPFVTLCGPILSIIYRFSLKWFCLKVIDMFSVTWICDFLRNYHVLRFGGYWQNGLRYEKSDTIFRILGKFPFRYIALLFFLSLTRMFETRSFIRFQRPLMNYFWMKKDMNLRFLPKFHKFIPLWHYVVQFCLSFTVFL